MSELEDLPFRPRGGVQQDDINISTFLYKNIEMHTKIGNIIFKLAQSSTLQRKFFRIIRMVESISDKALAGTEPAEMEHRGSPRYSWQGTTKTINKNPQVQ